MDNRGVLIYTTGEAISRNTKRVILFFFFHMILSKPYHRSQIKGIDSFTRSPRPTKY